MEGRVLNCGMDGQILKRGILLGKVDHTFPVIKGTEGLNQLILSCYKHSREVNVTQTYFNLTALWLASSVSNRWC